jgi:hypothetical protein
MNVELKLRVVGNQAQHLYVNSLKYTTPPNHERTGSSCHRTDIICMENLGFVWKIEDLYGIRTDGATDSFMEGPCTCEDSGNSLLIERCYVKLNKACLTNIILHIRPNMC